MDNDKIIMLPDQQSSSINPALLLALGMSNGGGFGGMNNPLWMMFMYPFIMPFMMSMYGNGFGGFGGFGGNNNGVGFLANQLNNDAGRDLILQAINGRADAISQLATLTNTNINAVRDNIGIVNAKLSEIGSQVGMSGLQVINAIQSGNSTLASQLAQCCCENRLLTTQQGYEAQIRTLEQTNQLGSQADRNNNAILNAIANQTTMITKEFCDAKERDMQDKINALANENATLKSNINNAQQTAQIGAMISALQNEITGIKASLPQSITLPLNNYTAVPTGVANFGTDLGASLLANFISRNSASGTTTGGTTPATVVSKSI